MRHKFNPRDGMSMETSTWKERKEIHQLLEDNGYNVFYKTKDRKDYEFKNGNLVIYEDGDFICTGNSPHHVYTYEEMKRLIFGGEPQYEVY